MVGGCCGRQSSDVHHQRETVTPVTRDGFEIPSLGLAYLRDDLDVRHHHPPRVRRDIDGWHSGAVYV